MGFEELGKELSLSLDLNSIALRTIKKYTFFPPLLLALAALVELTKSTTMYSLILTSHLFFYLTFLLFLQDYCLVTFGSIWPQKSAFFSLTLLSRSMACRHTKYVSIWQGTSSVSPFVRELCCYLSVEKRWFWVFIWDNCSKVLGACNRFKLLSFNIDLFLQTKITARHIYIFSLFSQHLFPLYTLSRFCRDFRLEL